MQIREREEQKKAQKREQGGHAGDTPQPMPSPQVYQQEVVQQKQPAYSMDPFKNDREAQKEMLARRMEEGNYNPYGKIGGGAPNKQSFQQEQRPSAPFQQNSENYPSQSTKYSMKTG